MPADSRIAYFINLYPAISHAFIRREIHALERQGFDVQRIALRGWEGDLTDAADPAERAKTLFVLKGGPLPLIGAVLRTLLASPGRFLAAVALALRMGWKATRPIPYHLMYLVEACRVLGWLREHGATHVHAHFGTNSAEIVMLVRTLGGPPYSFTVHGPLEFDKPYYLGLGEKIHRSAFTVAITSYTRSQLYRACSYADWPKVRMVRCGLQPEIFATPPEPPPATPRMVCIGRLVEQKGQALLVKAAARLARKGVEFKLVLVGGGPLHDTLAALITEYGLQEQVELTGALSTERLYEELRLARGMVLPSFAEGLPMVIMEAMALRRPVISTYIAGIPELVRPGENGWLIPAGSIDDLTTAMEEMLAFPVEQLRAMGEAAHKLARERHHSDTETAHLGELFRRSAAGEPITDA
ncbi:glycosyltransferase [Desulfurivibrio sp. D14AmB]|uniref:glycosyltransferase n=1 Tax=Desulfurivibrio sp. D14AmB TaxID=3374370 RepID=UPI00376F3FEB